MFFNTYLDSLRLKLVPTSIEHLPYFEEIFFQDAFYNMRSTQYMTAAEFLDDKFNQYLQGTLVPYTVISKIDNLVIGFSSLVGISIKNKCLENSGTWIGKKYQKNGYNCEIKYCLMKFIFEKLNFSRINFVVQTENTPSLNTFKQLDVQKMGLVRDWIIVHGQKKDGIMFIANQSDWTRIKTKFEKNLSAKVEF